MLYSIYKLILQVTADKYTGKRSAIAMKALVVLILSDLSADEVYDLFTIKFDTMESRVHALTSELRFLRKRVYSCSSELDAIKEQTKPTGQNNGREMKGMDDIRKDLMSFKRVLSNAFSTEKQALRGVLVSIDRRFLEMEGRLNKSSNLHLNVHQERMDRYVFYK